MQAELIERLIKQRLPDADIRTDQCPLVRVYWREHCSVLQETEQGIQISIMLRTAPESSDLVGYPYLKDIAFNEDEAARKLVHWLQRIDTTGFDATGINAPPTDAPATLVPHQNAKERVTESGNDCTPAGHLQKMTDGSTQEGMIENQPDRDPHRENALAQLKTPATVLLIVSCVSMLLSAILATMLMSAAAGQGLQITSLGGLLPFVWPLVILFANALTAYSALNILRLQSYWFSKLGVLLAIVPCTGPCLILGFPFALKLIFVMTEPEIRAQFTS